MNIHEYQAKSVLKPFGVPVLEGRAAFSGEEARKAFEDLPTEVCVVKAQIHAGGRGKAGGVKVVKSAEEAGAFADSLLGKPLVTHQTGPEGRVVKKVYVESGCDIGSELYFALLVDRETGQVSIISSAEGGVDIEEVAEKSPEKIISLSIDPILGFFPFHARRLCFALGLQGTVAKNFSKFAAAAYKAFIGLDASMVEINPLVVTKQEEVIALDAKVSFDDNALYRHEDIQNLRDEDEEDPAEIEASKHDLSYVKLDGTIGCMVNGAGLAMATMDIIKLYGEEPANFLDVGGGASQEKVSQAFKIILSDPNVKAILINIFGGIMRCDVIAQGIIDVAGEMDIPVPLVVRLEGTNVDQGKELLAKSGLAIIAADDLGDAAKRVVEAANGKA